MTATEHQPDRPAGSDESPDEHTTRTPDDGALHDVPDETVIEKTLPTSKPGGASGQPR